MFDFPEVKLFMDAVHGYIKVPKCFVNHLIDTEMFQRLRNIDQTGMRILYPNAKHDRFSHSLGVYHLGCKAADMLLENFFHEDYWKISSDNSSLTFWAKNKVLFLIACLLHDIGHAPFSHALESIVLVNSRGANGEPTNLNERLAEELRRLEAGSEDIERLDAAPHEIIGALYILTHMRPAIEKVFDDLADLLEKQHPLTGNILYAEHYSNTPKIDKSDLDSDMAFIARMILGLRYTGFQPEKQIRNCFIELLNGGNFDVDKLDYVIRDTEMSGICNIKIDIERLLSAVCIVPKTRYVDRLYEDVHLKNRGIFLLMNNNQENCFRISGRFRGTLLLKKGADVRIRQGSTFLSLQSVDHGKISYAEDAEPARFQAAFLMQDGRIIDQTSGNPPYKSLDFKNRDTFDYRIENAEVKSEDFHFVVHTDSSMGNAAELQVNGFCDIEIKGEFRTKSSMKIFDVQLTGRTHELVLLGEMIEKRIPDKNAYNEFSVGFKKQAINVIANVLEARDYLYLWIYAHHKVTYYANFLIPLVSREVLSTASEVFPPWRLDFENLERLDDSYVWTAIKFAYAAGNFADPEWGRLCEDLLSRKYRLSLYKSLAEFDLLFEAIPLDKRHKIKQYLLTQRHPSLPWLDDRGAEAGYLSSGLLDELKRRANGDLDGIADLVYVDACYKSKRLKANETFIVASDGTVALLDEIPLLADWTAISTDTSYYFYLYYRTVSTDVCQKEKEASALRGAIREFFVERHLSGWSS